MTGLVYRRTASKRRVAITAAIETDVLALLGTLSQNNIARRLGISQSAVSRIARRHPQALASQSNSTEEREAA